MKKLCGERKVDTPTAYRNGAFAYEPLGIGGYTCEMGVQDLPPNPSHDYLPYREDTKRLMALDMPCKSNNLSTMSDHGYVKYGPPSDQTLLKWRFKAGEGDLGSRLLRDGFRGYMPQMKHLGCMSEVGYYGPRDNTNKLF